MKSWSGLLTDKRSLIGHTSSNTMDNFVNLCSQIQIIHLHAILFKLIIHKRWVVKISLCSYILVLREETWQTCDRSNILQHFLFLFPGIRTMFTSTWTLLRSSGGFPVTWGERRTCFLPPRRSPARCAQRTPQPRWRPQLLLELFMNTICCRVTGRQPLELSDGWRKMPMWRLFAAEFRSNTK